VVVRLSVLRGCWWDRVASSCRRDRGGRLGIVMMVKDDGFLPSGWRCLLDVGIRRGSIDPLVVTMDDRRRFVPYRGDVIGVVVAVRRCEWRRIVVGVQR